MEKKFIAAAVFLIFIAGFAVFALNDFKLPFAVGGFTPVWCDTYEWEACGFKPQGTGSAPVTNEPFQPRVNYICNSDRCDVLSSSVPVYSSQPGSPRFILNGVTTITQLPLRLKRGDGIASQGFGSYSFSVQPWRLELRNCGSSACAFDDAIGGSGVSGTFVAADSCTFITDKTIYGIGGVVLRQPTSGSISYTVPPGEQVLVKATGRQTICGQKEAQCETDSDCKTGSPFVYNGKGADVVSGNLYTYSCNNYGTAPAQDQLKVFPGQPTPSFNYGARCESSLVLTGVCTPGSNSCGSNAVCNPATFKCDAAGNVACNSDAMCGSGNTYDLSTKAWYNNVCRNAGTTASKCERVFQRSVECAFGSECADGFYCDSTAGVCKQNTLQKTTCPTTCCDGDARYFDKPAPPGNICCPGGLSVAPTLSQCGQIPIGSGNSADPTRLPVEIIFAALFGLLAFALLRKKDMVLAVIAGGIVAAIIYFVLAFVFNNWILSLLVGGGIIYLFGGAFVTLALTIYILVRK